MARGAPTFSALPGRALPRSCQVAQDAARVAEEAESQLAQAQARLRVMRLEPWPVEEDGELPHLGL